MARPLKEGLDYFPHDVDASSDEKLVAMRAMHGNDGYAFYFTLLERIYRTNSGELDVSKQTKKAAVVSLLNISRDNFEIMMCTAIDVDLFDGDKYAIGIISSKGIKKRMEDLTARRERWRARRADFISKKDITQDNTGDNTEITRQSKAYKKGKHISIGGISDSIQSLFDYHLTLALPKHKAITRAMGNAVEKAMRENGYTVEDCKELLRRHSRVVELTRNKEHPVMARGFDVFFGQKAYQAAHLICSEYAEGGKFYELYKKQLAAGAPIEDDEDPDEIVDGALVPKGASFLVR